MNHADRRNLALFKLSKVEHGHQCCIRTGLSSLSAKDANYALWVEAEQHPSWWRDDCSCGWLKGTVVDIPPGTVLFVLLPMNILSLFMCVSKYYWRFHIFESPVDSTTCHMLKLQTKHQLSLLINWLWHFPFKVNFKLETLVSILVQNLAFLLHIVSYFLTFLYLLLIFSNRCCMVDIQALWLLILQDFVIID